MKFRPTPRPNRLVTRLAAFATAALLTACGGGGDAAGSGDDTRITLDSFTLSAATVSAPASGTSDFTATWSTTVAGLAATAHMVTAHAVPAGSSAGATDQNRFLGRTCSAAAPCTNPMTLACSYSSTRGLQCPVNGAITLPAGSYTVIAKACAYNNQLDQVCSERRTTLTLQ